MKTGRMLMIAFGVLAATPAFSASETCRSIRSGNERLACFDRETSSVNAGKASIAASKAKATKDTVTKETAGSKFIDPVDLLKAENDRVDARLKGICRGC
jgi:hypothetical protein